MRTNPVRALAMTALALFTVVGAGSAQTNAREADLLPPKQVQQLVATAVTPADHTALARHFAALAAKYDAAAADHRQLAAAYRKTPTASETKRPGTPDTAAHCERFAQSTASAAKEARAMAAAHERLATRK